MNVYVYQAALLCEDCGKATREQLTEGQRRAGPPWPGWWLDPNDEQSYDSDDYPKGPYDDGGGESDTPDHCDQCRVFLENPLTAEGYCYVLDAMAEAILHPDRSRDIVREWWKFYKGDLCL